MKEEELHHYCIVRNNLPISTIVSQLVHAAGESNPGAKRCFSVALQAKDLEEIETKLKEASIPHVAIREPDDSYDDDLLAIGINPINRSKNKNLRRIVSCLSLIKEKYVTIET